MGGVFEVVREAVKLLFQSVVWCPPAALAIYIWSALQYDRQNNGDWSMNPALAVWFAFTVIVSAAVCWVIQKLMSALNWLAGDGFQAGAGIAHAFAAKPWVFLAATAACFVALWAYFTSSRMRNIRDEQAWRRVARAAFHHARLSLALMLFASIVGAFLFTQVWLVFAPADAAKAT